MTAQKKTGVLLIQLGTPDSPERNDVARYLREFLGDPRVIDIPYLQRKLLVNGIIVPFRAPKSAKVYKELWALGNGVSPLLTYSESVQKLVQERFGAENVTIELAMRYQNPSMDSVLARMQRANYDQIIIIPLFPQYASASSGSAMEKAMDIIRRWWVIPEIKIVSQFYDHEGYIDSVAARAGEFDLAGYDRILFSYHGLPERHVDKVHANGQCNGHDCEHTVGEDGKFCYKATCYATTRLIAAKLGLSEDQYTVGFQSRLNQEWIRPFSDEIIRDWGKSGVKKVLAFSPAFVADCLETLIEIGDEYNELLIEHGGEKVQLVPSSNDHPRFIDCIEDLIRQRLPQ
jgi:ferrochelatase